MMLMKTDVDNKTESQQQGSVDTSNFAADQKLQAEAVAALAETRHTTGRNVWASVSGGVVELKGRVPSWYAKQLAQSRVLQLAGVVSLENSLRVAAGK